MPDKPSPANFICRGGKGMPFNWFQQIICGSMTRKNPPNPAAPSTNAFLATTAGLDFQLKRKLHNRSTANKAKNAILITLVMQRNPSKAPNKA